MKRFLVSGLSVCVLALSHQLSAAAFTPQTTAATRALDWIQQTQLQADGSVGGDPTRTEEVIWGLAANHRPYAAFLKPASTNNPLDYLQANLAKEEAAAGNVAQLILAVTAAGQDPASFGPAGAKHNLLNDLQADYNPSTGEYGADKVFDHAVAILALRSANQSPPPAAIAFLKAQQKADGGWSFDNADAFGTDTNTTALALVALASASSLDGCTVSKALSYLKAAQQPSGGFPSQAAFPPSDPDSDGIVIEGLLAVGEDPTGAAWTKSQGKNPLTDLLSFQQEDGSFSFPGIGPDNLLATTQPLVALASTHIPVSAAGTSFSVPSIPACQVTAATPTPTASAAASVAPTPSPVPVLAQTGKRLATRSPLPSQLVLFVVGLFAVGSGWRLRRRVR